jgi:hypothetical protein
MQFKICKINYWAVLSGSMYACYFSVYTSMYLCYSFWYRFESSLLIKGSLVVCFTLDIYNLSLSFRNWTKIYNESINLKCKRWRCNSGLYILWLYFSKKMVHSVNGLVLKSKINFVQLGWGPGGMGEGISVFWNCAQPKDTRTRQANSESVQWINFFRDRN